jgi:hypothetical protein
MRGNWACRLPATKMAEEKRTSVRVRIITRILLVLTVYRGAFPDVNDRPQNSHFNLFAYRLFTFVALFDSVVKTVAIRPFTEHLLWT